jgi:hypothetical protein
MNDPLQVEGDNHRMSFQDGVVRAAVWKRPDLDHARGAENAQQIERKLLDWLALRPRGLYLDVTEAPEVAGPKTEETIGSWFRAYADARVRIAVRVGPSAVQRMQYQRLLSVHAGGTGQVCQSEAEGLRSLHERAAPASRAAKTP